MAEGNYLDVRISKCASLIRHTAVHNNLIAWRRRTGGDNIQCTDVSGSRMWGYGLDRAGSG